MKSEFVKNLPDFIRGKIKMNNTYIREIDGDWYAFAGNKDKAQVYSIGSDDPERGRWCASWTNLGVRYVATKSPTRNAAYQKARRHGKYMGEG